MSVQIPPLNLNATTTAGGDVKSGGNVFNFGGSGSGTNTASAPSGGLSVPALTETQAILLATVAIVAVIGWTARGKT